VELDDVAVGDEAGGGCGERGRDLGARQAQHGPHPYDLDAVSELTGGEPGEVARGEHRDLVPARRELLGDPHGMRVRPVQWGA